MKKSAYIQVNKFKILIALIFLIIQFPFYGCKKLIEVDPPINQIIGKEIYKNDATASSVLTGIYTNMSSYSIFDGPSSISLTTGLSADELVNTSQPPNILDNLYTNSLTNNGDGLCWPQLYGFVFRVNSAVEGLTGSTTLSLKVKQQLIAESKFLRAFYYFYLVNLYGDVPLILTTDINLNKSASRIDKAKVYEQIIKDLIETQTELSDQYLAGNITSTSSDRLRPNKAVATALLARVYLYTNKWAEAEAESSKLIDNSLYSLESLNNVFLPNSKEAIWQIQPINVGFNTADAQTFVLSIGNSYTTPGPDGGSRPVYLSNQLFNAFESNDNRKTQWIDSINVNGIVYPYSFKYKAWDSDQPRSEYLMAFRLGEQYLIRAEARAQQGKLLGANSATSDLNAIRNRAGLPNTSIVNQLDLLKAIIRERRVELFTEWGHRWLDLKRTNSIDQVMTIVAPMKGPTVTWSSYKALYPIPVGDIKRDPNLRGHQNPGYPEQ